MNLENKRCFTGVRSFNWYDACNTMATEDGLSLLDLRLESVIGVTMFLHHVAVQLQLVLPSLVHSLSVMYDYSQIILIS
jgi:hypothetical protein